MAKKKSKKMNLILTIITMVVGIASFIPLLLKVWGTYDYSTITEKAGEITSLGGYFDDYSGLVDLAKIYDTTFAPIFSIIAGIGVCVATAFALLYIVGAVLNLAGKSGTKLCKIASIGMIASAVVIAICSFIFVSPVFKGLTTHIHFVLQLGAYLAFILPLASGILGLLSSK